MRAAKLLNDDPKTPLNAVKEPEAKDWPKAIEHHLVAGRSHEAGSDRGMKDAACDGSTLMSPVWHRRLRPVENRTAPRGRMNKAAGSVSES